MKFIKSIAMVSALALLAGCPGSSKTVANEKIILVTISDAVSVADKVCADVARAQSNLKLAKMCAADYTLARSSLVAAEMALNATNEKSAMCALKTAVMALTEVADILTANKIALPVEIVDGLKAGASLISSCSMDASVSAVDAGPDASDAGKE